MKSAKEKLSNMASAAKEHIDIYKAKAQEKVAATASSEEERGIASEIAKAKEAKAKIEFQEAQAEHAVKKNEEHPHDHVPRTTVPAYPLGGYRTHKYPL